MSTFHYPPEIFALLADAIPLLCRSKQDVFLFFKGAGVPDAYTSGLLKEFQGDRNSVNKYQITRQVLTRINEGGDRDLAVRREVLKRVVEFEEFSACWPDDQHKAKGLVADIRKVQNVKDSFTRMAHEREREIEIRREAFRVELTISKKRHEDLNRVRNDLSALFSEFNAQVRGKALEGVLNAFFRLHGILIKENFQLRQVGVNGAIEQIDGVIELDSTLYLVEMKWYKEPLGVEAVATHLVRVYGRGNVGGLFISASGFTQPALAQFREALAQKVVFCMELEEVVFLLDANADLRDVLRNKIVAAAVEKNPFVRMLPARR